MNGHRVQLVLAISACLFLLPMTAVIAEQPGDDPPAPVADPETPIEDEREADPEEASPFEETVTVTAKTYESPLVENPKAVTVVEQKRIARTAPTNVGELLNGMPGLAAAYDGAWGFNPTLRGLNKERIIVMTDGIRINSSQPYGAIASFSDVNKYERVEVVKGPTSFLYGSGAMGGVVNIIPRKFDFTDVFKATGYVSAGASAVDDGFTGAGGVALTGKSYSVDLSLAGANRDDYETASGVKQRTGYEQWSGTARFRARLAEDHSLGFGYQQYEVDDVWYPGSTRAHPAPPVGTITVRSPNQERALVYVSYDGKLGRARPSNFQVTVYRQDVERSIFGFSNALEKDIVRGFAPFDTNGGTAKYDLFLADKHTLTIGVEYWRTESSPERYQDTPPWTDDASRVDPFQDGVLQSGGIFIQDDVALGKWTLNAGARFDSVTGNAAQAGYGPFARTDNLKHTDNIPCFSVGAVHRLSTSVNPYVNLAMGFRSADMRERFESALRADGFFHVGNPQLDPERNMTAEAGVRGTHRRLSYTVSVYYSWIDDYIAGRITGDTAPNGFPIKLTENLAEVEIWGTELQLDYGWRNDVHVYLMSSVQYGQDKYYDEPQFQMPPPEVTLGTAYRPGRKWNADLRWRYVTEQDRVATQFSNGLEQPTPSFTTVDIRGGYRFTKTLELNLGIRNLLNEDYYEHLAQGVGGTPVLAPGRGFFIALNYGI
jgi:hemoglobin/transferrin/lactoferrin receptor protein